MSHTTKQCTGDSIQAITEGEYREHEILVRKCNDCPNFIIDVRSDNYDGEYLAGFITDNLIEGMADSFRAVDKHELDKLLLINVPF